MFKITKLNSIKYLPLINLNKMFFSNKIQNVGVIGSGQMGTGIAYVFGR